MARRGRRDEKWAELEERVKAELDKARKRALLAESFDEMEDIVDEVGQVIEREMLAGMAQQQEPLGRPACPECGERMYRRGRKSRQVKTSKGEVQFERERWVCLKCGAGLFPPGREAEA